ncbi:hypothetical protein Goshw_008510 [Gossypium schwendimanii]|uniref:Uncharacterized protein n=1 Tax=Gossypium schwendimanii TaxID=34291 RepID=A0A7J9L9H6_GOSSC|nr:hypothetical protein [Gossypium schwendimanii]
MVQEFYASFRGQEIQKILSWDTVTVIGKEVSITLRKICEFYDVPFYSKDFFNNIDLDKLEDIDMEDVIKYLTPDRGTWNHRLDTSLPPTSIKAKVPMSENEQFMKPTRSIIRDSLHIKYVELERKKIMNWNQRRKEKLDEMGLILQEFARLNCLRSPNYLPNIFSLESTYHDKEDEDEEETLEVKVEGDTQDLPRLEDENEEPFMEEAQQLELSMNNGGCTYQ